jgi:hypothetical protein
LKSRNQTEQKLKGKTKMEIKVNTLAHSVHELIFALLDNSIVFDRPQLTRQELIDMMQARSPWKGGYDKDWLENIVDQSINEWNNTGIEKNS